MSGLLKTRHPHHLLQLFSLLWFYTILQFLYVNTLRISYQRNRYHFCQLWLNDEAVGTKISFNYRDQGLVISYYQQGKNILLHIMILKIGQFPKYNCVDWGGRRCDVAGLHQISYYLGDLATL